MIKLLFLFTFFSFSVIASDTAIENKIICPKISEYYISNSKKTIMAMKDLVGSLVEIRETNEDLVLSLIELSKSKVYEERAGGIKKINEIQKALLEKQSRAKENYNDQLKLLASYSFKIKKCWSVLTPKEKTDSGEFINKFQQNKILNSYKECVGAISNTNNLYRNKYLQTMSYYNGKITVQNLESEHSILNKNILKLKDEENKKCANVMKFDRNASEVEMEKILKNSKENESKSFIKFN